MSNHAIDVETVFAHGVPVADRVGAEAVRSRGNLKAAPPPHRIGQQRPMTLYRLVAKDTIAERIVKLYANKRDLADTDDSSRLSYADMLALVQESGGASAPA